jgi:hypothetical protein
VIESLKKKKAADANGLTAELLQARVKELAPPITRLFNQMWASGEFPSEWNEGLLVPVFRKGDSNDCANYRTLTIGPVLGKLYAMAVERRLTPWAEKRGLRARGQAGFRHNHWVADHVFTLRALIDRATPVSMLLLPLWISPRRLTPFRGTCSGGGWRRLAFMGSF